MNEQLLTQMGMRIKNRRKELGMTMDELAKKTGYSGKGALSHIEAGRKNISTERLKAIATALDVNPTYLMGYDDEPDEFNIITDKSSTQIEIEDRLHNLKEGQLKVILSLVKEMES